MSKSKWDEVDRSLEKAVHDGVFPAAVLAVLDKNRLGYLKATGKCGTEATPLRDDAVFDVSSLTKPICTVSVIISLVAQSLVKLEDRLDKYFDADELADGLAQATIENLLSHSAGLVWHVRFFEEVLKKGKGYPGTRKAREYVFKRARNQKLSYAVGTKFEYSDLGFIILSEIIEKVTGQSLSDVCFARIFSRLEMKDSKFIPWREAKATEIFRGLQILPTEHYAWLDGPACGIVHDENSYVMGGVSGHAGLFTNVHDALKFVCETFNGMKGKSDIFPQYLCERFLKKAGRIPNSPWALGWKTPSREDKSWGDHFSQDSIGHLGFTGCSIKMDLENEFAVVLLSNRVNPARENKKILEFRPRIHNLAIQALRSI